MTSYDFERSFFAYLDNIKNQLQARPLVLGGVSSSGGGSGGPPGGFIGLLPQTQVAYDTTEAELNSGSASLLNNLNRIRYRIRQLELSSGVSSSGGHTIMDEGSPLTGRSYLDFIGDGVSVTDDPGNNKTIVMITGGSGSGHIIQHDGIQMTARTNLNFYGYGMDVTDVPEDDAIDIVVNNPTNDHTHTDAQGNNGGDGGRFEILNLLTAETNTNLVLSPAGNGDIIWVSGVSGGHVIQYSGISQTGRSNLNFTGGGVIVTDNSDNEATDVTIAATDIVRWVSVKEYGAKGNGSDDDTTAISNALAAIPSTGGVLYFPPGTYLTSGGFTLNYPIHVLGCGHSGRNDEDNGISTIYCNSATASLFTVDNNGCIFENIDLKNTAGTPPSAGAGITVTQGDLCQYRGLSVRGFYINIDIQVGGEWTMNDIWSYGPVKYGLKIRNTASPDWGDSRISNITLMADDYAADAAIRIESGGGIKIVNMKVNEMTSETRFVNGIDLVVGSGVNTGQLLISNSSIENVTGHAIYGTTSSSTWRMIIIHGCQIGLWGNTVGNAIKLSSGAAGQLFEVTITGCVFAANATQQSAVNLTNVNKAYIGGNIITGFVTALTQTNCTNISTGTEVAPPTPPAGMSDPTTTAGDLIYRVDADVVNDNQATAGNGASASASSSRTGHGASLAIDGDGESYWYSNSPVAGAWLRVDLGSEKEIVAHKLYHVGHADPNDWADQYKVQYSLDDAEWLDIVTVTPDVAVDQELVTWPNGVTAQYFRVLALSGGAAPGGWAIFALELYAGVISPPTRLPIGNENDVLVVASGLPTWRSFATGSGTGHTIQYSGESKTNRTNLNFIGNGVTVVDDLDNNATVVSITASEVIGSGGHIIQYSGESYIYRSKLNFTGGVAVTDDAENDTTTVNVTGNGSITNIGARVYHSTTQTCTAGQYTKLTFDSEAYDTDNIHDGTNPTRLTCNTAGIYLIMGQIVVVQDTATINTLSILLNNTTEIAWTQVPAGGTGSYADQISCIYSLSINDYVEFRFYKNVNTKNANGGAGNTWFSMQKIG